MHIYAALKPGNILQGRGGVEGKNGNQKRPVFVSAFNVECYMSHLKAQPGASQVMQYSKNGMDGENGSAYRPKTRIFIGPLFNGKPL